MAANQPSLIAPSVLGGVILIADPAKVGGDSDTLWQDGAVPAGNGVAGASGIWTKVRSAFLPGTLPGGRLPSSVDDRTVEICHNHDIVCSPGLGASSSNHTDYSTSEEDALGDWVADELALSISKY
jgi:hypothetical protein